MKLTSDYTRISTDTKEPKKPWGIYVLDVRPMEGYGIDENSPIEEWEEYVSDSGDLIGYSSFKKFVASNPVEGYPGLKIEHDKARMFFRALNGRVRNWNIYKKALNYARANGLNMQPGQDSFALYDWLLEHNKKSYANAVKAIFPDLGEI